MITSLRLYHKLDGTNDLDLEAKAKVAPRRISLLNGPCIPTIIMADEFRHKKISISLPYWQIRMLEEERGTLSMSKFVSELVDRPLMERRKRKDKY